MDSFTDDQLRELLFRIENCTDDGGYAPQSEIWNKISGELKARETLFNWVRTTTVAATK